MIYLDNAATTKMHPEVYQAMQPYFEELYGNPSSIYTFAAKAKAAVEDARRTVADFISAKPKEIYFTSSGTESDNWALMGMAFAQRQKGKHIITSRIEHHAVINTCVHLEKMGFEVTYLDVDKEGFIDPAGLEAAIRDDTILVSIMTANNEIGTIEPIAEIGAIARRHGVSFHTDAVQAFGHIPIDVDEMNIDLLSASGHKFGGSKGVGILYVRESVQIDPLIYGGGQERNRRAGTYNTPGVVGFAKATELASRDMDRRSEAERRLRDYLIERVISEIPGGCLNGPLHKRLPNNANFTFEDIDGDTLLIMLDQNGICCSSGSACSSGSIDPSHVLLAIGVPGEIAKGSLRVTPSYENTAEEIDEMVEQLKKNIAQLRGYVVT